MVISNDFRVLVLRATTYLIESITVMMDQTTPPSLIVVLLIHLDVQTGMG